jgi:hypothetical protein
MTSEPIYLKLEYDESVNSKKNLLSAEMSLLNIIKLINRYSAKRAEEFRIKMLLSKAIKEMHLNIKKTKSAFPFVKMPEKEHEESGTSSVANRKFERNLEDELREINEKLRALG